ncbi:unnamed protein product [Meloidogyne enterolobii]|uniref:Uncharacterized protein n=1 Tax=Meloidogyne enterolobii TaxID=390850 RepID=A0ACB0ZRV7_MELEN
MLFLLMLKGKDKLSKDYHFVVLGHVNLIMENNIYNKILLIIVILHLQQFQIILDMIIIHNNNYHFRMIG